MKMKVYWVLALFYVGFGIFSFDSASRNWSVLALGLYLLPLLTLLFKVERGRYALFVCMFFVAVQSIVPPFIRGNYFTLQPNLHMITRYEKGQVPGVEGDNHLTTDGKGYRVTKTIDYARPALGFRIFTIGASTTEMYYIDDRKTWSHLLQEKLSGFFKSDFEVVNTGVSGLRAEQNLATLKHIKNYHPDVVLFMMSANDWRRQLQNYFLEKDGAPIPSALAIRYSLKESLLGLVIQSLKRKVERALESKGVKQVLVDDFSKHHNPNKPEYGVPCKNGVETYFPQAVSESFSKTLRGIREVCESKRLTCVFLTQPNGYRPNAEAEYRKAIACNSFKTPKGQHNVGFETMNHISDLYNKTIKDFAVGAGMRVCDVASQIPANFQNYFDDVHFNEPGARRVSEVVFSCVKEIVAGKKGLKPLQAFSNL